MENDKMQRMIKFELKRSFKNRLFLISLLISLALVTWYSIERIPYCVQLNSEFLNDENLMGFFEISYTNWIGSHNIYLQQNIFYMAIPILATLPFGSSFYDDINRGYARNVCVRAKKKYYLVAKYIAVFVSGGCVVAIPMVLSFLISSMFLPTMLPEASYTFTNIYPAYKWADLFYVQPLLYTSIYIFITFLFSGVTASLSLFITFFLDRKFVTFVFPFFIYIFHHFVLKCWDLMPTVSEILSRLQVKVGLPFL